MSQSPTPSSTPRALRFKDLMVGDTFEFANPALTGPWVKRGWRMYARASGVDTQQYAVGTILVKVVRIA